MTKYAILGSLVFLGPLVAAEDVTFRIDNVPSDDVGRQITAALAKVPGVRVTGQVTKDSPRIRVSFDPAKADLGDLARAAADGEVIGTADKPAVRLVLGYERFDDSLHEDKTIVSPAVERALAKLKDKGVEGTGWKLDPARREVGVRLTDGAKLADTKAAFPLKGTTDFPLVVFELK
jgi:hypothetical protein